MPTYDYQCEKCGHKFSLMQSISEHDKAEVICPECKDKKVKQLVSIFTARTSRKS